MKKKSVFLVLSILCGTASTLSTKFYDEYIPHLGPTPRLNETARTGDPIVETAGGSYEKVSIRDKYVLKSDMKTYFGNLWEYSPLNSNGSCGYVSFIQYLSYYDTFYNDSIIPEEYERSKTDSTTMSECVSTSPGVLRQGYPSGKTEFYNYVQANSSIDFQAKLMSIKNSGKTANDYSAGIGMWDYKTLFDHLYGENKVTFSYKSHLEFASSPNSQISISSFDSYIKQKLDLGMPVIVHMGIYDDSKGSMTSSYHSVVAYYYDENGIHYNFGWGKNDTDDVIPSNYVINYAGVADFTLLGEMHSNNYTYSNNSYCGCGEHFHEYKFYQKYNSVKHKASCLCGHYELKNHVFKTETIEGGGSCVYCGYKD